MTFGWWASLTKARGQHWVHLLPGEESIPFPIPRSPFQILPFPPSPDTVLSKTDVKLTTQGYYRVPLRFVLMFFR